MRGVGGGALASKRRGKKKEKERLQRQLVNAQKYSKKEVKKLSYNQTLSITKNEKERQRQQEEKERKHQKRKAYIKDLRNRKLHALDAQGFNLEQFTDSYIDKITLKEIEAGFNREAHEKRLAAKFFDFDKIYSLKNDEVIQFAFRDFAGETSLGEILSDYSSMSNKKLLEKLKYLNSIPPTYSKNQKKKGGGNSSGAAGDYKFLCGQKSAAVANRQDTNTENTRLRRHPKRKAHGAQTYNGYQFLKSNGHHTYTNEITPRNLLIVTCAIMANVTERDRVNFYNRVYNDLVARHMPDLLPLLPYPQ